MVFIQIVFYGFYLFFSLKIFERLRNFSSYYLLVFSPFLLSFQVNSFDGGYRKEILFLVLLSGLVWTVHYRRELFPKLFRISLTGTLALAMVAIDWGRFIYVNASAICFLSTLTKRKEETGKRRVHLIPLLLYSLCWRLPHVHPIETFFLVSKKTGDVMPYLAPVQWLKLWFLLLKLA